MTMTISELLKSTESVDGYSAADTFGKKQMGSILTYNKTVRVKPNVSVIEITMMIRGMTETVSRMGGRSSVAAHKVMVAISGVRQRTITGKQLASMMRFAHSEYSDTEKYSDAELIERAINGKVKPFKNSTIFRQEGTDKYVQVQDEIDPDKAKIQVWCSCSSYYWVFQFYNIKENVNIRQKGAPVNMPPYRYKTQKGFDAFKKGKPMRNPGKSPGVCKHLMLLLAMLMTSKVIGDSSESAMDVADNYQLHTNRFKKDEVLSEDAYEALMRKYDRDRSKKIQERKLYSQWGSITKSSGWFKSYNAAIAKKMR